MKWRRPRYILSRMKTQIYPIKLTSLDRRLFRQAARAESKSMAEWLREAGRERANRVKKRFACLDYPDWPLSREAERDKDYVSRELRQTKGER